MKRSPLGLDRYFFTKVVIEAQGDADPSAVNQLSAKVDARKAIPPTDPQLLKLFVPHYRVTLTVRLLPDDTGKVPYYTGEIVIHGFFRISRTIPPEKRDKIAAVNGAGLLFGAVREMVANLTARGPNPMVTLISLNFSDMTLNSEVKSASENPPSSHRKRESPAEEGVASANRTFAKILEKADPKAAKKR